MKINGYQLFRKEDAVKNRGGGVALYVRNEISAVYMDELNRKNFNESLWCNVNCRGQNTLVGVCYRAPDSEEQNDLDLMDLLDEVGSSRVVIMGDFNFARLDWSNSSKIDVSHPFVDCLGRNFLIQHVEEPSRGKNFLDLIVSSDNAVDDLTVGEPFETSDHQIIRFEINMRKCHTENKTKKFSYFKTNYDKIREHAGLLEWEGLHLRGNRNCSGRASCSGLLVENMWRKLKRDLIMLRDKYIKLKSKPKNRSKWELALSLSEGWIKRELGITM